MEPGTIYATHQADGTVKLIDLTTDAYRDQPKHKRGTVKVTNVAAFKTYFGKHESADGSEVFADLDAATITAVLDAHTGTEARWQQHRLVLALKPTRPWLDWLSHDGDMLGQQAFAEFIEQHAGDVATDGPVSGADLLEIAQSLQANTKVEFGSGKRLADGQTQLTYKETTDAMAGNRGQLTVPSEISLAIRPYEDCPDAYRVRAWFRYRILPGGELKLGYVLHDPARKAHDAVATVAEKVESELATTVMHGTPAPPSP